MSGRTKFDLIKRDIEIVFEEENENLIQGIKDFLFTKKYLSADMESDLTTFENSLMNSKDNLVHQVLQYVDKTKLYYMSKDPSSSPNQDPEQSSLLHQISEQKTRKQKLEQEISSARQSLQSLSAYKSQLSSLQNSSSESLLLEKLSSSRNNLKSFINK